MEIWKPIATHSNTYEVSNQGRVKNIKTNRLLKCSNNGNGYLRVELKHPTRKAYVHRLVAEAFLNGTPMEAVNHKDFNPANNSVENLEWCTRAENSKYSADRGRFVHDPMWLARTVNGLVDSLGKPVERVSSDGDIKHYAYLNLVANDGYQPSCVCNCCKGIRKTHAGYKWRYA